MPVIRRIRGMLRRLGTLFELEPKTDSTLVSADEFARLKKLQQKKRGLEEIKNRED